MNQSRRIVFIEFISQCFEPLKIETKWSFNLVVAYIGLHCVVIKESGYNTLNQSGGRSIMLFEIIV